MTLQSSRLRVVCGGLLIQTALGAGYAWSVFGAALGSAPDFQLNGLAATLPLQLFIGFNFVGSLLGSRLCAAYGPRFAVACGGVVFASGMMTASLARSHADSWVLTLGYGAIGGTGLGISYFVLISFLRAWFSNRPLTVVALTGLGFGLGAFVTALCGQWLIERNSDVPTAVFLPLGVSYLVLVLLGSVLMRPLPPEDVAPVGNHGPALAPRDAVRTSRWWLLAAVLTVNAMIGLALIAQTAVSAAGVAGYSSSAAAALVGGLALVNGCGPVGWLLVARRIGTTPALAAILGISGLCALVVPHASHPIAFLVAAATIWVCYGGGFGVTFQAIRENFGLDHSAAIYRLTLVGWSLGGLAGPLVFVGFLPENGDPTSPYTVLGILGILAVALTFGLRKKATP